MTLAELAQQLDADWMDDGACIDTDPTPFFPKQGRSSSRHAKAICGRCPVVNECLAYALTWRIEHGVWGNATVREREKMVKPEIPEGFGGSLHLALVVEPAVHGTTRRYRRGCKCIECLWIENTRQAISREKNGAVV
jgi:WhiB family redox-sensing transcriptional regulator